MLKRDQIITLLGALLLLAPAVHAQQVLRKPVVKQAVVAVLADAEVAASAAFGEYCQMLETKEGLGVYAVGAAWKNPEQVRELVRSIRKDYPGLEGLVLIGRIPVPMIRNGQHMTTAFKMDELKYHRNQSSVASDRFYDDLALQFRYIGQDSAQPDWFYYELLESGPQVIRSELYTGRIMSHATGQQRVEEISAFLRKAVAAREQAQPLDQFMAFTGGAYNSESLTSWYQEQLVLQEIMPALFKTNMGYRPLHFSMDPKMKYRLFSELQRPGLDLALLTEHGDIELQYINNSPAGNDATFALQLLRYQARTALRRAVAKGQSPEAAKEALLKKMELPAAWFDGALDNDSLRKADSLVNAETNIVTADLATVSPVARMVIFNACYNGSFHHPENISAAYLFGKGQTLVTHGNTTNVLQDKWTIEHLGLLYRGARAGQWSRLNNTLESSLNGDPTWRFQAAGSGTLNKLLAGPGTVADWEKQLLQNDPVMQSLALRKLFELKGKAISPVLRKYYEETEYRHTRMEALKLLARIGDTQYVAVAGAALFDPYELIRRKSAEWIAKAGHHRFAPLLINALLAHPEDARLSWTAGRALDLLDWDNTLQVLDSLQSTVSWRYDGPQWISQLKEQVQDAQLSARQTLAVILDPNAKEEARIQRIRLLRNMTYHALVPELLPLLADAQAPEAVRINLAEALGWFVLSYQKPAITAACQQVIKQPGTTELLKQEATQTITRLNHWSLP
ncbi:MAG: HEAT repeat domain-containing protein [Candidatus Pseudobacter hemicellulosilyticus]|uniref:HEAT repeat domain-containing protein n=1 Tax=Candidatus Pseudobacter hemicellulosilyticus TaxID=3121375 RepID=A0AAJ5WSH9_9BACT|nr:MAG: HEAT repeat domain-containing protein [Pseudobacter sp.]